MTTTAASSDPRQSGLRSRVCLSLVSFAAGCRAPAQMPWTLVRGDETDASCPTGYVVDTRLRPRSARRQWAPESALAPARIPDDWASARATDRRYASNRIVGVLEGDRMWWVALEVESHFPHSPRRTYLGLLAFDASGFRTSAELFEVEGPIDLQWAIVDGRLVGRYAGKRQRPMELRTDCRPWFFDAAGIDRTK